MVETVVETHGSGSGLGLLESGLPGVLGDAGDVAGSGGSGGVTGGGALLGTGALAGMCRATGAAAEPGVGRVGLVIIGSMSRAGTS